MGTGRDVFANALIAQWIATNIHMQLQHVSFDAGAYPGVKSGWHML
jgi:hypothetical protein